MRRRNFIKVIVGQALLGRMLRSGSYVGRFVSSERSTDEQ